MRWTRSTQRSPTHARKCSDWTARLQRTATASSSTRQRAQELAELIERARRDIAEAENKRKQQAAQIEQTNSSIAEIERALERKGSRADRTIRSGRRNPQKTERSRDAVARIAARVFEIRKPNLCARRGTYWNQSAP